MKFILLIVLCLMLFIACQQEKIELPDTGRKIVINGLISTDSLLSVFVNKSVYISEYDFPMGKDLENAKVYIYQNNICIDSLTHDVNHLWKSTIYYPGNYWSARLIPLPGDEYKIVAKVPGLPDATASTKIPDIVNIERVDTSRIILVSESEYPEFDSFERLICKIEFTDPKDETNYYLFNIGKSFLCQDPIVEEKLYDVNSNNGQSDGSYIEGIAFSDKVINGQKYSLTISIPERGWYNDSLKTRIFPKLTLDLKLYSITEEYFKYIQTLNLYNEKFGNPLTEPVLVYSNITGGYGIFAGSAVSCKSIIVRK